MSNGARRHPGGPTLLAAGALALAGGILAPVALAPPAPVVTEPPPSRVCVPSGAQIITSTGTHAIRSLSELCYLANPTGGAPGTTVVDRAGGRPAPLVLRVGETVRFDFAAAPESVVTLTTTAPNGARRGPVYRLSPYATTWRVRPGAGTMVVSTTQWLHTEPVGLPAHIETVRYITTYRTVARR